MELITLCFLSVRYICSRPYAPGKRKTHQNGGWDSRFLLFLVIPPRFGPAAAIVHVAPSPPLAAALIEEQPAAKAAFADPDAHSLSRAQKRECFACEDCT